jgi:steroid delta-isomerase-like uncharacterized protein
VADNQAMTTQENKAIVQRFVTSVFEQLNADAIDELVAPDFVSHTWGFKGDARESLKQVTQRMGDSLSDIAFVIDDLIAEDDKVAARLTSSATQAGEFHGMPPSGKRYSIGEIHIFRITDGKIAEHWHQYDLPGLMSQLKGSEGSGGQ